MSSELDVLFQALGILFMLWIVLELTSLGKKPQITRGGSHGEVQEKKEKKQ
jgi:hypothetical protein